MSPRPASGPRSGGKVTREAGLEFGTTVIAFVEDPDGYKIEPIERRLSRSPTASFRTTLRPLVGTAGDAAATDRRHRAGPGRQDRALTSLAAYLVAMADGKGVLPALSARLAGTVSRGGRTGRGAAESPRFDYGAHMAALAADPPRWPARTDAVRCWRWSCGSAGPGCWAPAAAPAGGIPRLSREWLLDLPLLAQISARGPPDAATAGARRGRPRWRAISWLQCGLPAARACRRGAGRGGHHCIARR